MPTLLVKNAELVATFDDQRREIPNAGIFVRDGFIVQVVPSEELPKNADEVLDLSGHILLPGLVVVGSHTARWPTCAKPSASPGTIMPALGRPFTLRSVTLPISGSVETGGA